MLYAMPKTLRLIAIPLIALSTAVAPVRASAHSTDDDRGHPAPVVVRRVPSDPSKRCPKFEPAFRRYGLKPVQVFSYLAYAESRCRIKAINIIYDAQGNVVWALNKNGTFDSGLLQVNSGHAQAVRKICGGGLDLLLILDCNLRVAKYLLDNGGLAHWSMG